MITISPFSKIVEYYNFIHDSFVSLAVLLTNCLSVFHVVKTHDHFRISETIENKRLEIKLFVQCLCTTTFLMVICSIYALIFFMGWTREIDGRLFVVFHLSWIFYHTCCPLVYLFTNEKLRLLMGTMFFCFRCD
uniref:7TM GPCR serpentine receptor class x (Srx) domain-containing protein n=1 Tax=Romanomermis culicivorax TaxID=13658 RepID=A0A915JDV3_ROMCU